MMGNLPAVLFPTYIVMWLCPQARVKIKLKVKLNILAGNNIASNIFDESTIMPEEIKP